MSASAPMDETVPPADADALLLMLSYVEAECRRLGALDAAELAALAAASVQAAPAPLPGPKRRPRGATLH